VDAAEEKEKRRVLRDQKMETRAIEMAKVILKNPKMFSL
jgi:hypothetical protein